MMLIVKFLTPGHVMPDKIIEHFSSFNQCKREPEDGANTDPKGHNLTNLAYSQMMLHMKYLSSR